MARKVEKRRRRKMKGGACDITTQTNYIPNLQVPKNYQDENNPYQAIQPLTHFSANIAQSMYPAYPQYYERKVGPPIKPLLMLKDRGIYDFNPL